MKNYIDKIIAEEIKNAIKNDNVIINITSKDSMRNYIEEVWNMLLLSYKENGGFLGAINMNALFKNASLITLYNNKGNMAACAVYRKMDGNKIIGIGCDQTEEGKEGIKCIIQRDIENFADFYWVEASGAVEHWIQKYRGFPIPNIYAPMILVPS